MPQLKFSDLPVGAWFSWFKEPTPYYRNEKKSCRSYMVVWSHEKSGSVVDGMLNQVKDQHLTLPVVRYDVGDTTTGSEEHGV